MDDVTIQDLRVDSVRWRAEGYAKGIAVTPLAPQPRGTQQQQGAAPEELSGRRTPGPELIPGPPPPPPPPPGLRTVPLSRMVPPPSPQGTVPPELRASVCWTSQDAPSFSTIQPRAAEVRPVQEPGRLPEARILGVALGVSVVVGMGLLGLGLWLLL
ncbi:MAG TPA: hypothetical protein ENK18_12420 [Deltaproteobacteria bacterium]|nr:hypothetical protein [Deltaproteobacteria bacterium]